MPMLRWGNSLLRVRDPACRGREDGHGTAAVRPILPSAIVGRGDSERPCEGLLDWDAGLSFASLFSRGGFGLDLLLGNVGG